MKDQGRTLSKGMSKGGKWRKENEETLSKGMIKEESRERFQMSNYKI